MPLPIISGALSIGSALGGKEFSKAAQGVFNAQTIVSGVEQVIGAIGKLPTAPITAFVSAINAVNAPVLAVVDELKSFVGAVGAVGSAISGFVQLANPVEVQKFNLAMDDFNASFGKILLPLMKASTAVVRGFADVVFAASGPLQSIVASFFDPITRAVPQLTNSARPLVDAIEKLRPGFEKLGSALAELGITTVDMSISALANSMQTLTLAIEPTLVVLTEMIKLTNSLGSASFFGFGAGTGGAAGSEAGLAAAGGKSGGIAGGSVGAATRPAQIGSVEDYGRRAQQAAFSLGTAAEDPAKKTANATEGILNFLQAGGLKALLMDMIPGGGSGSLSAAALDAVSGLVDSGRRTEDKSGNRLGIKSRVLDFFN